MSDKFKRSLLPETLRGVVLFFTGQAGAGKSIGSLLDPGGTIFIDGDHFKGRLIARDAGVKGYFSINSTDHANLVEAGERFIDAITGINMDTTTVVVFDNLYEIEEALHAYVIANSAKVGRMMNKLASKISGRQWGQDVLAYERLLKGIVDQLLANDVTVIITAHMKPKFGAVGQLEIKGRNWVYEAASLVGIMVRTDGPPDMLVFKNSFSYHVGVDVNNLTDEQFEQYRAGELESSQVYQRVPRRIPSYTPTKLFKYLARTPEQIAAKPYGPDELLDEDELRPYVEILTKQQMMNVEKLLEREDQERKKYEDFEANLKASLRADLDQAIIDNAEMAMGELVSKLKREFSMFAAEITPMYVMEVRGRA